MARNGVPWLAIGFAVSLLPGAQAVDLKTVDRHIQREPKYPSGSPQYCLLVFGPKAEARVWLVRDGDLLYVDRNGNGDLTEDGEKVARFVPKEGEATKSSENWVLFRTGLLAPNAARPSRRYPDLLLMFDPERLLMVLEHPDWPQGVGGSEPLQFAGSPQEAPIIHFDGPLTLALDQSPKLIRGQDAVLVVLVGTPGLGRGTFAIRPHRRLTVASFLKAEDEKELGDPAPEGLKVVIKVRDPGGTKDAPAARYVLEGRC